MPLAVSVRTLAKLLVQVLCNAFKSHLPKHKRKEIEMKLSSCSQKSVGIKYESVNKMFVLHVHGHVAVQGASYIVFPFWPLYSCSSFFFFSHDCRWELLLFSLVREVPPIISPFFIYFPLFH